MSNTWLAPKLPAILIGLRFVLGPLLFWDAADGATTPWFLVGFVTAFLADIFDGVIARRLNVVTAHLREADGWTDVWFYAWVAASAWQSQRAAVVAGALPIALAIGAQTLAWLVDWLKYRRFSNYHTYLGKFWGITLFVAVIALFGYDMGGVPLWVAATVGVLCALEEIAITLLLDRWTYDVPSIFHARRLVKAR